VLFSLLAVTAIAFSGFGQPLSASWVAGFLTITLLFASILALPRTFLAEEEQRTFALTRLLFSPATAYVGKLLFNVGFMIVLSLLVSVLLLEFSSIEVQHPWLFYVGVCVEGATLAAATSFCGALSLGAANRWVLAATIALPLTIPQVILSISILRAGLESAFTFEGLRSLIGLGGFGLALAAGGSLAIARVWRLGP